MRCCAAALCCGLGMFGASGCTSPQADRQVATSGVASQAVDFDLATSAVVVDISVETLEQWMQRGDTVLIDVRERDEYAAERIDGAVNAPLSSFDVAVLQDTYDGKRIVFHCRAGHRSRTASNQFLTAEGPVFHFGGGIQAWKASGRPTITN